MPDFIAMLTPHLENGSWWIYGLLFAVAALESLAFVGLVIPGTTVVIAAGVLASRHLLDIPTLIWCVALGGTVGDCISFVLGRKGITLFSEHSRFFKKEYLVKGEAFFLRHGDKSILLARFFGPFRPIVPFVAGVVRMDSKKFLAYNFLSALLAAAFYVGFGYFFGESWRHIRHLRGVSEIKFLIVLVIIGVCIVGRKQKKLLK